MLRRIIIMLLLFSGFCRAQRFADQIPQVKKYTQAEVYDSINGITLYNKLIENLSGDSVKYNKAGYNAQGWNEDFYKNGKTLHKGYYVDGKLKVFKNFYENGQVERSFVNPDPLHAHVDIFYENGLPKRKISYYEGKPQKYYEFYDNGLPKSAVENEKEMKYITLKKSWYANGQIEDFIELKDKKEKIFTEKKYYMNGQVKEEGNLKLSADGLNYLKEGMWTFYDENGKNKKTEKFTVQ
jgi:antitoxin component YwqK of YwqJK toxin-antitoxin module